MRALTRRARTIWLTMKTCSTGMRILWRIRSHGLDGLLAKIMDDEPNDTQQLGIAFAMNLDELLTHVTQAEEA